MNVLGIETSCDECSAAVLRVDEAALQPYRAVSVATHSQIAIHQPFGGVVPEIASRNHLETINPMILKALEKAGVQQGDLDLICVTHRPGLIGALLVGVSAAKALAYALDRPLVGVHHLEGHAASVFLDQEKNEINVPLPALLAIVSGGHSNLYLMQTPPEEWPEDFLSAALVGRSLDDAAGEAFDKTAKLLGFPYPGGIWIDRESQGGDARAYDFPRALPQKTVLNFSFSGLKTAVALEVRRLETQGLLEREKANLCASIQEAIVDALLRKILSAIGKFHCRSLLLVGGVAGNSRLRERLKRECPVPVILPLAQYCTDNAAMIAAAGYFRFKQNRFLQGEPLLRLGACAR